MKTDQIINQLEQTLSRSRFAHSLAVSYTAAELAKRYGADADKARLAGLVHDCARDMNPDELKIFANIWTLDVDEIEMREPVLLHAPVGAALLSPCYGIGDQDICRAVRWHTVGASRMTLLDKVVYLADYIEPGRDFPGVDDIRALAAGDLDQALLAALDQSIEYVARCGALLHPGTVRFRDSVLNVCRGR